MKGYMKRITIHAVLANLLDADDRDNIMPFSLLVMEKHIFNVQLKGSL